MIENDRHFSAENPLKITILISGSGSNMQVIAKNALEGKLANVRVDMVISDQADAAGINKAKELGINAFYLDSGPFKTKLEGENEDKYIELIKQAGSHLICLAGFMRMLKPKIISAFPNRIINIHPSLLPAYPGLHTHERALADKAAEHGCTVHFVDNGMDSGTILAQRRVTVLPDDTASSLQKRVLEQEHLIYSEVLQKIINNEILIGPALI